MGRALARVNDASQRFEKIRRQRYGCMLRLFRHRYGAQFPDDSAGREDLWLLIQNVSLVPFDAERRVRNTIETWAPWMSDDEVDARIGFLMKLTTAERLTDSKELGRRFNVTNAERIALKLWQFHPVDLTDDELIEWRKKRKNERRQARRRSRGVRSREQYLAELKAESRPWEAEGISRAEYYRRRKRDGVWSQTRRGVVQINSNYQEPHLVSASDGFAESESGESPSKKQLSPENGLGTHGASPAKEPHLVSSKDDLARIAAAMRDRATDSWRESRFKKIAPPKGEKPNA